MSATVTRSPGTRRVPPAIDPRWADTPLAEPHWLECGSGFPPGSVVTAPSGPAADVLSSARGITLTRRRVDEVVAFAEWLAGTALPDTDRADLMDDIVDAFDDSPVALTRFLRRTSGVTGRMAGMDAIERSGRRLQALTATWTIEQRRTADGGEVGPVMEVVGRHNPMVRYWAATGVVLVADAVAARVDQHRLVLSLIDGTVEPQGPLTDRLLARADEAGVVEAADLSAGQVRLMCLRAWLRDMGDTALGRLRTEVARAVRSALDVDVVVQQLGFRAALAVASTRGRPTVGPTDG